MNSLEDKVILLKGDITEAPVEAIVNAANTKLVLGSGVAGAIRKKGGPAIQSECDIHGPIGLGEAAITGAGNLKAKHVIHAAAMHPGGKVSAESLQNSTMNSLDKAKEIGIMSIAFPAIGTGVGGYPIQMCAEVMLNLCISYLKRNPASFEKIYFVLFDDHSFKIFKNTLQKELGK